MKYYIAYGSNLNKAQMKRRCPDAKAAGTTELKDYELLFKGSGSGYYLTAERKEGSSVPCGVWEVTEEDEKNLDIYEGYPSFYRKEDVSVTLKNFDGSESEVKAFVYIMDESRKIGVPTRAYYEICENGYRDFGLNQRSLKQALSKSRKCELIDKDGKNDSIYQKLSRIHIYKNKTQRR